MHVFVNTPISGPAIYTKLAVLRLEKLIVLLVSTQDIPVVKAQSHPVVLQTCSHVVNAVEQAMKLACMIGGSGLYLLLDSMLVKLLTDSKYGHALTDHVA